MTLQTLIDRVVGKKGVFRAPSWWMHKILSAMATDLGSAIILPKSFSDDFNEDFAI